MKTIVQIGAIIGVLFAIDYYFGTNAFGLLLDSIRLPIEQEINNVINSIIEKVFDGIVNKVGS